MLVHFLNGTAGCRTVQPVPEPASNVVEFWNRTRFSIGVQHIYMYTCILCKLLKKLKALTGCISHICIHEGYWWPHVYSLRRSSILDNFAVRWVYIKIKVFCLVGITYCMCTSGIDWFMSCEQPMQPSALLNVGSAWVHFQSLHSKQRCVMYRCTYVLHLSFKCLILF